MNTVYVPVEFKPVTQEWVPAKVNARRRVSAFDTRGRAFAQLKEYLRTARRNGDTATYGVAEYVLSTIEVSKA